MKYIIKVYINEYEYYYTDIRVHNLLTNKKKIKKKYLLF